MATMAGPCQPIWSGLFGGGQWTMALWPRRRVTEHNVRQPGFHSDLNPVHHVKSHENKQKHWTLSPGKGLACVFKSTFNRQQIYWCLSQTAWPELLTGTMTTFFKAWSECSRFTFYDSFYDDLLPLCPHPFTPSIKVNRERWPSLCRRCSKLPVLTVGHIISPKSHLFSLAFDPSCVSLWCILYAVCLLFMQLFLTNLKFHLF